MKQQDIPAEMNYEQLLELRERTNQEIEDLQAALSVVNQELLIKLDAEKLTGKIVGNWGVTKAVRYSFKTSIDEARALGAIKESVDSTKLKILLNKGIPIPGVSRSEYITVRAIDTSEKVVEVGKSGK